MLVYVLRMIHIKTSRAILLNAFKKFKYSISPGNYILKETKRDEEGNFIIGTKHGVLRILEIQKPGGKMLKVSEFLRGFNFPFGEILESLEMKDLTH